MHHLALVGAPAPVTPEVRAAALPPLEMLCRRWAPQILIALMDRPLRFSEMLGGIEGISDRMLTARLRELTERGWVSRHLSDEGVRVSYSITEVGLVAARDLRSLALDLVQAERGVA